MDQNIKQAAAKFSVIRFVISCGLALLVFLGSGGYGNYGAQLVGICMLFLALFAAVFDPFSTTHPNFKPQSPLEWAGFAAGLIGIGLFGVGLYTMLG